MTSQSRNAGLPVVPAQEKGKTALIASIVIVAVVAIGGLAWANAAGAPTPPSHHAALAASGSGTPTSNPSPKTSPTPTADGPTASPAPPALDPASPETKPDPRFGQPVAATKSLTEPATLSGGITAHIDSITPINAKGQGIGEVSGPAVSIAVTLTNTTASAVSLDQVSVGGYYGDHAAPGSPIMGDKDTTLHGALAPGASASGTYVYSMPKNQRSSVIVTVTDAAGAPLVVFH